MTDKKRLMIGVTVNLEHYENLRIDVEGDVKDDSDTDELVRFLDRTLARFGRADPATAKRVDSYRERVLNQDTGASSCHNGVCALPEDIVAESVQPKGNEIRNSPSNPVISGIPIINDTNRQGRLSVTEADTSIRCDTCGAMVSPAEKKASQLFAARTLCKTCLKTAR